MIHPDPGSGAQRTAAADLLKRLFRPAQSLNDVPDARKDKGEKQMKRLTLAVPFKFGQSKKSSRTRFPTMKPSGTTPASSAMRPKAARLNALVRDELTPAKK